VSPVRFLVAPQTKKATPSVAFLFCHHSLLRLPPYLWYLNPYRVEPALVLTNPDELHEHLEMLIPEKATLFILTDSNVAAHCLPALLASSPRLESAEIIELEPGEGSKSLDIVQHIYAQLIESGADRKSVLLNLGGGVVTDIGGFVGSTYKRGLSVIHMPTSLMAMVDAAIGGKTGIDFLNVKNCIGTFAPEITTLVYPEFLTTLPEEERRNGWAEIMKHALVADQLLWKEVNHFQTSVPPEIIAWNIRIKEEIIAADFHESGERKLLNFGHTLGHAIESYYISSTATKPHGHCIAIGMVAAVNLSVKHTQLSRKEAEEITANLITALLPENVDLPAFQELIPFLAQDKKNEHGQLRFILLEKLGKGVWNIPVTFQELESVYREITAVLSR
jgi:3-dehydroquinate synthase